MTISCEETAFLTKASSGDKPLPEDEKLQQTLTARSTAVITPLRFARGSRSLPPHISTSREGDRALVGRFFSPEPDGYIGDPKPLRAALADITVWGRRESCLVLEERLMEDLECGNWGRDPGPDLDLDPLGWRNGCFERDDGLTMDCILDPISSGFFFFATRSGFCCWGDFGFCFQR